MNGTRNAAATGSKKMKTQNVKAENADGRIINIGVTINTETADHLTVRLSGTMIDEGRDDVESMGVEIAPSHSLVVHAIRNGSKWTLKLDGGRTVTEGVSRRDAIRYAAATIADDVLLDDYYPC